jgi:hypothetical protein
MRFLNVFFGFYGLSSAMVADPMPQGKAQGAWEAFATRRRPR